jgi:uncharacterized NAD-dependent epimerase/dehydratase family protein
VIDRKYAGHDALEVLDGKSSGIPVTSGLEESMDAARSMGVLPTHWVMGLAPDGGRMTAGDRKAVIQAIEAKLHVDSGLHDFLTEDPEISRLAGEKGVILRDVRKPPPRDKLHFFSGKIQEVKSWRIALLGTDSAVGKRTTAWLLTGALERAGISTELVGTGQTAWMQGVRYGLILDSLVNDFLSGEIEHAVWSAWKGTDPDVIVIEGQGSLLNPAYPGGYEILAAARPHGVILQHAPVRKDYDGFPGFPIHPLSRQIQAVEVISGKPVFAITVNHENIPGQDVPAVCENIERETGLPAVDPLIQGCDRLAGLFSSVFSKRPEKMQETFPLFQSVRKK